MAGAEGEHLTEGYLGMEGRLMGIMVAGVCNNFVYQYRNVNANAILFHKL